MYIHSKYTYIIIHINEFRIPSTSVCSPDASTISHMAFGTPSPSLLLGLGPEKSLVGQTISCDSCQVKQKTYDDSNGPMEHTRTYPGPSTTLFMKGIFLFWDFWDIWVMFHGSGICFATIPTKVAKWIWRLETTNDENWDGFVILDLEKQVGKHFVTVYNHDASSMWLGKCKLIRFWVKCLQSCVTECDQVEIKEDLAISNGVSPCHPSWTCQDASKDQVGGFGMWQTCEKSKASKC